MLSPGGIYDAILSGWIVTMADKIVVADLARLGRELGGCGFLVRAHQIACTNVGVLGLSPAYSHRRDSSFTVARREAGSGTALQPW